MSNLASQQLSLLIVRSTSRPTWRQPLRCPSFLPRGIKQWATKDLERVEDGSGIFCVPGYAVRILVSNASVSAGLKTWCPVFWDYIFGMEKVMPRWFTPTSVDRPRLPTSKGSAHEARRGHDPPKPPRRYGNFTIHVIIIIIDGSTPS